MGVEDLKGNGTLYKEKWEKEANIVISVDVWQQIHEQDASYLGVNMDFKKKKTRFFITLAAKNIKGTRCWRLCGANKAKHFYAFRG